MKYSDDMIRVDDDDNVKFYNGSPLGTLVQDDGADHLFFMKEGTGGWNATILRAVADALDVINGVPEREARRAETLLPPTRHSG